MVVAIGIAAFLVTFCVVASKTLLSTRAYQARVIEKKEVARNTLNENVENVDKLAVAYKGFVETSDNVLGGSPSGKGDKDGDNAKVVLDALPSKYDFPALTSSLEKLVAGNYELNDVTGIDQELAEGANTSNPNPIPIEVPFDVTIQANSYASTEGLFRLFERSIRPFEARKVNLTSDSGSIEVTWSGVTYYQPAKSLEIQKEVVL